MTGIRSAFCLAVALCLLAACAGGERTASTKPGNVGTGGHYKVGQPYQIGGNWYYPKEDYSYDETGIASWYGDDFHEKETSNGEIFNKNELTAAHKTLPMPSLARVTNLDNGRSIVVRINDRGPFSGARIIDVTQRAAQLLGFEAQGTAKVRVQVLADESKAIADAMRRYGSPAPETKMASATTTASAPLSSVTSQKLDPPPGYTERQPVVAPEPLPSKAEAHVMMQTIKPVPEYKQLQVSGKNKIFIQAGAFTQLDNATRLQRQLKPVGLVSIADVMLKGVKFYRVRLGPVADVAEADRLLKKVTHAGASNARIVVD
jgi:rare lipoprotein A